MAVRTPPAAYRSMMPRYGAVPNRLPRSIAGQTQRKRARQRLRFLVWLRSSTTLHHHSLLCPNRGPSPQCYRIPNPTFTTECATHRCSTTNLPRSIDSETLASSMRARVASHHTRLSCVASRHGKTMAPMSVRHRCPLLWIFSVETRHPRTERLLLCRPSYSDTVLGRSCRAGFS